MKKSGKLFLMALLVFLVSSCNKEEQPIEEQVQLVDNRVTINKLVEITNKQTQIVKKDIELLSSRKARMSSGQYDNFVRRHIEEYCGEIIAIEPIYVGINNLQINKVDLDDWSNDPTVLKGDAETTLPKNILTHFDAVADRLQAIDDNPIYDTEANLNSGGAAMENVLQDEINALAIDPTLSVADKQMLTDAFQTAKALVQPEVEYFKTLAAGAELLGEDMSNWRKRSFFGRVIRAVARVAIAVVSVAVLTAIVVKTGGLLGAKFAVKYGSKGFVKKILFGISKTGTPSKTLKWYSAMAVGLGPGIIKAAEKWDTTMKLETLYKDITFKAKASY